MATELQLLVQHMYANNCALQKLRFRFAAPELTNDLTLPFNAKLLLGTYFQHLFVGPIRSIPAWRFLRQIEVELPSNDLPAPFLEADWWTDYLRADARLPFDGDIGISLSFYRAYCESLRSGRLEGGVRKLIPCPFRIQHIWTRTRRCLPHGTASATAQQLCRPSAPKNASTKSHSRTISLKGWKSCACSQGVLDIGSPCIRPPVPRYPAGMHPCPVSRYCLVADTHTILARDRLLPVWSFGGWS